MIKVVATQGDKEIISVECNNLLLTYDSDNGDIKTAVSCEADDPMDLIPVMGCSAASSCVTFLKGIREEMEDPYSDYNKKQQICSTPIESPESNIGVDRTKTVDLISKVPGKDR